MGDPKRWRVVVVVGYYDDTEREHVCIVEARTPWRARDLAEADAERNAMNADEARSFDAGEAIELELDRAIDRGWARNGGVR